MLAQIADIFEDSTWRWILVICVGSPLFALAIRFLIDIIKGAGIRDSKFVLVIGYYVSLVVLALPAMILASRLAILLCIGYGLIGVGPILSLFVVFSGSIKLRAGSGHCKACGYFLGSAVDKNCPACGAKVSKHAPS